MYSLGSYNLFKGITSNSKRRREILLKCIFKMWNVEVWTGLKDVSFSIN